VLSKVYDDDYGSGRSKDDSYSKAIAMMMKHGQRSWPNFFSYDALYERREVMSGVGTPILG
jgi:hypothetical protein